MAETSKLTNSIRSSIKGLEARAKAARGGDQKTMVTQTEALKKKFRDAIARFQQVEKAYRDRTRQRMERQFRIVRPDDSPQEIQAAIEDDQGGQIFSQAVCPPSSPEKQSFCGIELTWEVDDLDSPWRSSIGSP